MIYKRLKTLIEVFPDWMTAGLFAELAELFEVPWEDDPDILDAAYIGGHSGDKPIAPIVNRLLTEAGVLDDAGKEKIARIVWATRGDNWTKIYDALMAEYNPIENYNMTETGIESEGVDTTRNATGETETKNDTRTTDNSTYGFNSAGPVPADTQTETATDKRTSKDEGAEKTARLNNRSLKRSGNIGVTTTQQMLESELALRRHEFFDLVFSDIDEIITLPIYCSEEGACCYEN